MGSLTISNVVEGLIGSLRFFRDFSSKLKDTSKFTLIEAYVFISILGVYLYSKYCKCGVRRGDSYTVVSSTVSSIFGSIDDDLARYVARVIITRNRAAHLPYIDSTNDDLLEVLSDPLLRLLLRYERIIDYDGNFIEPLNGKYISSDSLSDALESLRLASVRIVRWDKEAEEIRKSVPNSLLSAISKNE